MQAVLVILGVVLMVIAGLGLPISIIVGIYDLAHGMEFMVALWEAAKVWMWILGGGLAGFIMFVVNVGKR